MPIHATPIIGVEAFNKSIIKLIPRKKTDLQILISVDKLGNLTDAIVLTDSGTGKELDLITKKKIEETFKQTNWNPSTVRGVKITDNEFVYEIYTKN